VVLALQDRLAYAPTFEVALASLFGSGGSSLTSAEAAQAAPASSGAIQPAADLNGLIAQAGKAFTDYQRLTAEGKLGEAGEKLDELKQVIEKLNAHPR
jgi:hypothetical protein